MTHPQLPIDRASPPSPTSPTSPTSPPGHVTSEQLAAFLDGRLHGREREDVVAHLAACHECRGELIELRGALASHARPRVGARVAAGAAIAAALLFAVVPLIQPRDDARLPVAATTRVATDVRPLEAPPIPIVAPAEAAVHSRDQLTLAWRAAGPDAMYLVTVQDTAGNVIWTTAETDTSVIVPSTARLAPAQRYFWSVDARLGDGQTARTGVHSFTVR